MLLGGKYGMFTLEQSLRDSLAAGDIEYHDVVALARDPSFLSAYNPEELAESEEAHWWKDGLVSFENSKFLLSELN